MGVHLYFSNQLMPLVQRLQQNLMAEGSTTPVLDAPLVIVPNMNLSKWIKLTLARQADVMMNVAFAYLEKGLWQMIGALAPHATHTIELLDRERLTILLFFILMALDGENDAVRPINHYLRHADGQARTDMEMRCWQLAEELSRLFQEYEYHRADMIQRWCSAISTDDAMEGCQQWLFSRMQALKSQLGTILGRDVLTMTEYASRLLPASDPHARPDGQPIPHVHFFGLSQISPFHIDLLSRLKSGFAIHIYALNPSREYWEDIKTPVEKNWIRRKNVSHLKFSEAEWSAGDLFSHTDHELLSAWGKPGRETIRLLCQLADYDFDAGFSELPDPDTVLAAVNHGLLTLDDTDGPSDSLSQDTSLQIMACPGIRREVETVYHSILYNLETDPDLSMTDIAVMVSDMSRYKPVVDSVFTQRPARISYNLVDASARSESVFAQAVLNLMALARGSFTRKAVFDFLRNPCVMHRWSYTPETLAIWIEWADALGIFHGFENPNHDDRTLPEAGLFSWRQGLERLRLSRIMTPPATTADSLHPHFNGLAPFADINSGDNRLVEKFSMLIPALHAAVTRFHNGPASAGDWRDTFFNVIDQFVDIAPDMHGEETVFQSLLKAFEHFVCYDDLIQVAPGTMLTAETLWAFVRSHLKGIAGGQGDYLTGGVTVSALMPMRPIPFKIVYVLGLEEGRFPGSAAESVLDLRSRKRRIGDVNLSERNRYLFLEILISVRDKLYLSYVSKDLQKDRDLAPCSVVHQLRRHVERQVLGGRPFKIQQIPVQADSRRYLEPGAINSWSDVMVNTSVAQRISSYRRNGWWAAVADKASPAEQEAIARYDPDYSLPAPPSMATTAGIDNLTIGLLRGFLLDPVAVAARYHLGIFEQVDSTTALAEIEHEPLASRFPVDFEVRTSPVQHWLAEELTKAQDAPRIESLAVAFDNAYADLARKSRVPAGSFAIHDRSRLKAEVLVCGETLSPLIQQMQTARRLFSSVTLGTVRVGTNHAGGSEFNLEAVDMAVPGSAGDRVPARVLISGGLPWVWQADDERWHCLIVTGSGRRPKHADKYVLGPLLTLMAIAASGKNVPWVDAGRFSLHVGYRQHMQHHEYELHPARCSAFLKDLMRDFYAAEPLVWLPFEPIFSDHTLRRYIEKEAVNDADRQVFFEAMQGAMQGIVDPVADLCGASIPATILDQARRRFRVFLPEN